MEGYLNNYIHQIDDGEYLEKIVEDMLQGKATPRSAAKDITGRFASDLRKMQGRGKTRKKAST